MHLLDDSVPVKALAKHVLTMTLNGCFVQVLHRYLFSTTQKMPDRLRQILIEAGVNVLENAIAIETKPELAQWSWYKGAFNQYHAALLLLVEVYAYPMRKDAARIWKALDYIFDIPSHLSPKQKAELVLTDLRDRMEVYHQMRKIRSTTHLEERVHAINKSVNRDSSSPDLSAFADLPQVSVQMPQHAMAGAATQMLPMNFSPPPVAPTESSGSGSRQGSVSNNVDVTMGTMEDIDWVS